MSCWALYATDCHNWLLNPWKTDKAAKQMKIKIPKPSSTDPIGPISGIDSDVTTFSTIEFVNWELFGL